jgi:hypothetical protein
MKMNDKLNAATTETLAALSHIETTNLMTDMMATLLTAVSRFSDNDLLREIGFHSSCAPGSRNEVMLAVCQTVRNTRAANAVAHAESL